MTLLWLCLIGAVSFAISPDSNLYPCSTLLSPDSNSELILIQYTDLAEQSTSSDELAEWLLSKVSSGSQMRLSITAYSSKHFQESMSETLERFSSKLIDQGVEKSRIDNRFKQQDNISPYFSIKLFNVTSL